MNITHVKVLPVLNDDKLKAFATITISDSFVIRDIKIIKSGKQYLVAMPSKKAKDGTFMDVAHPITKEARKEIEDAVMAEYNKIMKGNA